MFYSFVMNSVMKVFIVDLSHSVICNPLNEVSIEADIDQMYRIGASLIFAYLWLLDF